MTAAQGREHWFPAYVGLGSNLDTPMRQLDRAVRSIAGLPQVRVIAESPRYRSPPLGPVEQPDYVNAVLVVLTTLDAASLLEGLQRIEAAQGRRRDGTQWGPRTLDLDLLVFADRRIRTPSLEIPHPGVAVRNFVLLPLSDVAPHLMIPGHGSVSRLVAGLGDDERNLQRL